MGRVCSALCLSGFCHKIQTTSDHRSLLLEKRFKSVNWRTKRRRIHLRAHRVLLKGVYDGRSGRSIYWQGWQEKHRKAWSVPFKGLEGFRTEWISFNFPVGQKL